MHGVEEFGSIIWSWPCFVMLGFAIYNQETACFYMVERVPGVV